MNFAVQLGKWSFALRSSLANPEQWLVDWANLGGLSAAGQVITERNAIGITAVSRCINVIANATSGSPLEVFRYVRDAQGEEIGREADDDHPLYRLLHDQPNDEMTAMTFRHVLQSHLLSWGNCYAEIERDGAGRPIALWPLRPDRTFPKRAQYGGGPIVYVNMNDYGQQKHLDAYDVLHVLGFSFDGLRGYSPIALHREALGLARATEDYGARFFGNDARPGGALRHPHKVKPEAAKRLKESWEELHRGSERSHKVAVLEEGMEWQAIGLPNEDAQFLETRKFSILEICRIFGVPPHKVMDLERATFSNIEQQAIEFVQDAVLPWAERWEQEIWRKLLLPSEQADYYCEHNLDHLLRGDSVARNQAYSDAWTHGRINVDEIRRRDNLNPLPNGAGARYYIPSTMIPADGPRPAPAQLPGQPKTAPPVRSVPGLEPTFSLYSSQRGVRGLEPVFHALAERVVRKECSAVSRALKSCWQNGSRAAYGQWHGQFFGTEHTRFVFEVFLPAIFSVVSALQPESEDAALSVSAEVYADGMAARVASEAREHFRFAGAVERPEAEAGVEQWSRGRTESLARREFALAVERFSE